MTATKNALGIIFAVQTGIRNSCGTDWPVENMVRKVGRNYYLDRRVVQGICRGGTVKFSTKTAAIQAAQETATG